MLAWGVVDGVVEGPFTTIKPHAETAHGSKKRVAQVIDFLKYHKFNPLDVDDPKVGLTGGSLVPSG